MIIIHPGDGGKRFVAFELVQGTDDVLIHQLLLGEDPVLAGQSGDIEGVGGRIVHHDGIDKGHGVQHIGQLIHPGHHIVHIGRGVVEQLGNSTVAVDLEGQGLGAVLHAVHILAGARKQVQVRQEGLIQSGTGVIPVIDVRRYQHRRHDA
ncbi:hypothetical protein D3C81_1671250 [compost metagenome]